MKNLKIKYKILFPILFLLALVASGNLIQLYGTSAIQDQAALLSRDVLPGIKSSLSMNADLSGYRQQQYGFLLSASAEDEQKYLTRMAEFKNILEQKAGSYQKLIGENRREESAAFKEFMVLWDAYQGVTAPTITLKRDGDPAGAAKLLTVEGRQPFEKTAAKLEEIVKINERAAQQASDTADKEYLYNKILAVALLLGLSTFGLFIVHTLVKAIAIPIDKITDYMAYMAQGNLDKDVPSRDLKDEVGGMARAVQIFKDNMVRQRQMESAQKQEEISKQKRQSTIDAAVKTFELSMTDIVKFIATSSSELQMSARSLSVSAEQTSKQSGAVVAASQQAAANVQTVASATEELSSSINEIASQVSRSSQVASRAVEDARLAGKSVSELVNAAQKIGDVTAIISGIAEQTNLLALNATIEAARAGEAGKGFAVVASEVKNLANEATKATEEISSQIAHIQTISKTSAEAIDMICRIIGEIDEISGTISAAIQEQTSATQEISRNVSEAYAGTSEVTENIGSVSEAANSTGSASHQVLSAADALSKQSDILKKEFDSLINSLAAA